MPRLFSNYLKAVLVMENIAEQDVVVTQTTSFTVQQFSYECSLSRDDSGNLYGQTIPSYLDFTVRVSSDDNGKAFFERMQLNESFPYSFLFNVSFNNVRTLADCEDAMVATGYVVDVEEVYDNALNDEGMAEQMLIKVKLLLSNIAYLGKERILDLKITND